MRRDRLQDRAHEEECEERIIRKEREREKRYKLRARGGSEE